MEVKKKSKRGGFRPNAGRKKSNIQKKTVSFDVPVFYKNELKIIIKKVINDFLNSKN